MILDGHFKKGAVFFRRTRSEGIGQGFESDNVSPFSPLLPTESWPKCQRQARQATDRAVWQSTSLGICDSSDSQKQLF